MLSTVRKMAVPGKMAQCGAKSRLSLASKRMRPHVGISGGNPRPRKDRVDSGEDGRGHVEGAGDDDGAEGVGQDVSDDLAERSGAQTPRRLHELLLAQGEELRAHEPGHGHPAQPPDEDDDHDEDARFGAQRFRQHVAEEIHDEEQERELGQGEEEIGDPHERVVHRAAGLAGDGADGGAHRDGHEHGGDAHASEMRPP
jgi:hypothetical protein